MKKIISKIFLFCFALSFYAQTYVNVDLSDSVYYLLKSAETKNLCSPLNTVKPYSEFYIKSKLNEILDSLENVDDSKKNKTEIEIVKKYIEKYNHTKGLDLKNAKIRFESENEDFPTSFEFKDTIQGLYSFGLYKNSSQNSQGYEFFNNFNFTGDLGNNLSYRTTGYIGLTCIPLEKMGTYDIGKWLYHRNTGDERIITVFRNNSFMPYAYNKYWDGSIYYLTNLSSSGLEGWPEVMSLAFGMYGDISGALYDGKVEFGLNRIYREWGGMDDGSSLVLNANASPFFGGEAKVHLFDWLSLSTITGILEFPNQAYMIDNAWYPIDENGKRLKNSNGENESVEDYYFFQNAFSMTKVDFSYKGLYIDFGSTCIWPKRFELGYAFPLIDRVVYQNSVGDYDNLALFGNIKYTKKGFGSFWFSAYLDEVSEFKINFWEKTRAMYAAQAGTKINLPFLPFGTLSFRYTKVEPYCYTHHGINYTSWYDHYISESYTNNGTGLGYYLQPNSDEFNLKVEMMPSVKSTFSFEYQLIRHGVDWGSGAGLGNNFYSELDNMGRDSLNKYFLKDGVYEWSNIVTLKGSYKLDNLGFPIKLFASIGYIYDWFTSIDADALTRIKNKDYTDAKNNKYHYINNDEYSDKNGFVITLGFEVF